VDCVVETGGGHKWPNIKDCVERNGLIDRYRQFWFMDYDIEASSEGAERLLDVSDRHGLRLCQPSLTPDSYRNWPVTYHEDGQSVRLTDFVEIMCPLFDRVALMKCLWTFSITQSGWGLDFLWSQLLGGVGMGVVDAVQVRHTRPARSHRWVLPNGATPKQELSGILSTYGLSMDEPPRTLGRIP
jgi:hypothetical protein